MTKKHLQFCIYYMQVGDPQVAYKMTYPRAAVKSLKASVSRLMARPDVAEWVNGTEERVHNRMMRKFHNEHYDQFKEKLLTINEKRTVLTKIIKGETKRVRYIKVKYGVQKVEEDLPADTVLRAIDLDTRLENFYNYLTRSDTWRKAQNIYVNTPTLQQQVNILISQTSGKEEDKNTLVPRQIKSVIESPLQGDRGILAQETPQPEKPFIQEPTFPLEGERGTLAFTPTAGRGPDSRKEQKASPKKAPCKVTAKPAKQSRPGTAVELTTEPVPPNAGLTQKKDINRLTTERASSLTQKKNIKWLTKVNNSAKRSHCHHSKKHQAGDNLAKRSHCYHLERHQAGDNSAKRSHCHHSKKHQVGNNLVTSVHSGSPPGGSSAGG